MTDEQYEQDARLLSEAPDDFLSKPNTEVVLPTVKQSQDERNVCVAINVLDNDPMLVKGLINKLSKMCATNQTITDKHTVALRVLFLEANKVNRLGFCDELTASNIVYRICEQSGIATKVYREHGTPNQRMLTPEDLGKRPFRF